MTAKRKKPSSHQTNRDKILNALTYACRFLLIVNTTATALVKTIEAVEKVVNYIV